MSYKSANTVQTNIVKRLPTGLDEIDFLYGFTEFHKTSGQQGWVWGIPEKSISLWAGETGVGKTRFAIEVARKVARKKFSVIYFQNEMPLGSFVQRIKADGGNLPNNLYVSEATKLADQLNDIKASRAQLVFVDSINMLQEFGYGSDLSIKRVIEGYRDICNKHHCSIILLSQMTKGGKTRGSNALPHLVDMVFKLESFWGGDKFIFKVGNKHRYGQVGGDNRFSAWLIFETHVKSWSDYSVDDKLWCQSHNINWVDRLAVEKAKIEREQAKETKKFQRNMIMWKVILGGLKIVAFIIEAFFVGLAGLIIYEGFRSKRRR